ncbi:MAG TPA: DedA family protein [Burkholderiales bacterium]|jgi:membrane protein DedA with SNARE-associated domain|nr:DedA family protein [Burkholderiales bacterium]
MLEIIAQLGYVTLFIGTFLEGESVLALAGVAASYGYLTFEYVVAVAALGAFLGDQACFWIGRRYGASLLARYPRLAAKAPRVEQLVRRWDAPAVIVLRFLYGLRIAGPIVIGSCGIPAWRLALFNFIGVLIWAPLVACVGYFAGYALEAWIGRLKQVQIGLLMALLVLAAVAWIVVQWRRR